MDIHQATSYDRSNPVENGDEVEKRLVPEAHNTKQTRPKDRGNHRLFEGIRVGLRACALILTISVLAVQAHSYYVWDTTSDETTVDAQTLVRIRLWPILDLSPVWTMLAVSAVTILIHVMAFGTFCGCVSAVLFMCQSSLSNS
jgi:hypothetical protein